MYSHECSGSTTHHLQVDQLRMPPLPLQKSASGAASSDSQGSHQQLPIEPLPPKPILRPVDRNRWGQRALAKTAILKRDFTLAKRYIDKLATRAKDRKDMPAYASALNETAFINILMGKPDVAQMLYRQIHEIWKSLRMVHNSVGFNDYMFFLWDYSVFLRNQNEDALAERLEKKLERLTMGMSMTFIHFSRAERLADRGQFNMAEQFYEDAFVEAGMHKDLNMQLRIADRLAPVYQITGKNEVAEHLYQKKMKMERARCLSMFGKRS